jgi:hypothetical protein
MTLKIWHTLPLLFTSFTLANGAQASCVVDKLQAALKTFALPNLNLENRVLETQAGQELISALGYPDLKSFRTALQRPDKAALKKEFKFRLQLIQRQLAKYTGLRVAAGLSHGPDTPEEQTFVSVMAERFLKPSSQQVPPKAKHFFAEVKNTSKKDLAALFNAKPALGAQELTLQKRATNLLAGMRDCIASSPQGVTLNAQTIQNIMTQLAVNEAVTVGSAELTAGEGGVQRSVLTSNMASIALSSGVGTFILSQGAPMYVRFFRGLAFSEALNGVSAGVYMLSSSKNDQQSSAFDFAAFNMTYTAAMSPMSFSVNEFIRGLQCLYPEERFTFIANLGGRLAYSFGSNLIYFELMKNELNSKPKKN